MKKQLMKVVVCLGIILAAFSVNKTSAKAYTTGTLSNDGHLYSNGHMVINDFVFDGTYTYYAQADGTPMKDRLTYHRMEYTLFILIQRDMKYSAISSTARA